MIKKEIKRIILNKLIKQKWINYLSNYNYYQYTLCSLTLNYKLQIHIHNNYN